MTTKENTAQTQAPKIKYEGIIKYLLHGWQNYDQWLEQLQGALEFKRKIPKSYIYGDHYSEYQTTYAEFFDIGETKEEAKKARQQLIKDIINTMMYGYTTSTGEILPDHYARLFHALTVLKLEKDTELFSGTTKNMMFNAMYMLWRLDDGSKQAKNAIGRAAWYIAEEIKKRSGQPYCGEEHLILGLKC